MCPFFLAFHPFNYLHVRVTVSYTTPPPQQKNFSESFLCKERQRSITYYPQATLKQQAREGGKVKKCSEQGKDLRCILLTVDKSYDFHPITIN